MKWGLNMALIGKKSSDMFSLHVYHDFNQFVEMTCNVSKCFLLQVMDTGSHSTFHIVSRMEAKVNFRVMGRDGETLSRMYDDQRENLISPLPTRCSKVRH